MKKTFFFSAIIIVLALFLGVWSANAAEPEHKDDSVEEHEHEPKHGGSEHSEEAEGAAAVGPDKGIVAKGPLGFQLSPEAKARFAFKTENFASNALPCSAIVSVKDAKYVFRVRDGWIKKIHVDVESKTTSSCKVKATDLKIGDQIVISRTGFLRISEVILEEGASHAH